jgi:hypothetical protein
MPAAMAIVLGLTIAGILAMFLVWRELDWMDRFLEEMDEWERLSAMLECSEYEADDSSAGSGAVLRGWRHYSE